MKNMSIAFPNLSKHEFKKFLDIRTYSSGDLYKHVESVDSDRAYELLNRGISPFKILEFTKSKLMLNANDLKVVLIIILFLYSVYENGYDGVLSSQRLSKWESEDAVISKTMNDLASIVTTTIENIENEFYAAIVNDNVINLTKKGCEIYKKLPNNVLSIFYDKQKKGLYTDLRN